MYTSIAATATALLLAIASARPDHFNVPEDDRDLFKFQSRPDITPPRFNITTFDADQVAPGYIFVAPYDDLLTRPASTKFHAGQTGPHIYDQRGELVWSGAHLYGGRTTFDFKVSTVNGTDHLSFIIQENQHAELAGGAGVILDSSYTKRAKVVNHVGRGTANMHEFSLIDNGRSALWITFSSQLADISPDPVRENYKWMGNNGFTEVDVATGKATFEWWALDHVEAGESSARQLGGSGSAYQSPWDFFHANSVEKDADGDYLLSARYTNTIYKISGKDGSIIWRFGGRKSDFTIQGFNFSSQHDARQLEANGTHVTLSLFDNASDGVHATAKVSSAFVVALNKEDMTASLVKRFDRPDGFLSELRGNMQRLSGGNTFVCWSENARLSEFTPEGQLVYDAQFAAHRFVTYRGFKFNFIGQPQYPPVLKAFIYGASRETSTTVLYASWNGATEVATWNFFGVSKVGDDDDFKPLGTVKRNSFETMYMVSGYNDKVVAEAVAANGTVLGRSLVEESEIPPQLLVSSHTGDPVQEWSDTPGSTPEHSDASIKKPASSPPEQRPEYVKETFPKADALEQTNGQDSSLEPANGQDSSDGFTAGVSADRKQTAKEETSPYFSEQVAPHFASTGSTTFSPLVVVLGLCAVGSAAAYMISRFLRRRRIAEWKELAKYDED